MVLIIIILLDGCGLSDLEKDICTKDSDCNLNSAFGGCHTDEFGHRKFQELASKGAYPDPVMHPENAYCVCEDNKCVQLIRE